MMTRDEALDATIPDERTGLRWAWARRKSDGRLYQSWRAVSGQEGIVWTENGVSIEVPDAPRDLNWNPRVLRPQIRVTERAS